jgi:hypothetical protein
VQRNTSATQAQRKRDESAIASATQASTQASKHSPRKEALTCYASPRNGK